MTTWLTSDPHYGHTNILKYTGRPFADVTAMDEFLIETWNEAVAPDDDVFVLGDIALGKLAESLKAIGRLNGRKVMVPGNHDRCWTGQRKGAVAARQTYLDAGFAEIIDSPDPWNIDGRLTLLSHFPYRGDSRDVERHGEHRPVDRGGWLIHGHVHQVWRQRGRMINVGVDAWAGRPVSLETVSELIAAGPQDLDPLPWAWPVHDDRPKR